MSRKHGNISREHLLASAGVALDFDNFPDQGRIIKPHTIHFHANSVAPLKHTPSVDWGLTEGGNTVGRKTIEGARVGFDIRNCFQLNLETLEEFTRLVGHFVTVLEKGGGNKISTFDKERIPLFNLKKAHQGYKFCGQICFDEAGAPFIRFATAWHPQLDPKYQAQVKSGMKKMMPNPTWLIIGLTKMFGFELHTPNQLSELLFLLNDTIFGAQPPRAFRALRGALYIMQQCLIERACNISKRAGREEEGIGRIGTYFDVTDSINKEFRAALDVETAWPVGPILGLKKQLAADPFVFRGDAWLKLVRSLSGFISSKEMKESRGGERTDRCTPEYVREVCRANVGALLNLFAVQSFTLYLSTVEVSRIMAEDADADTAPICVNAPMSLNQITGQNRTYSEMPDFYATPATPPPTPKKATTTPVVHVPTPSTNNDDDGEIFVERVQPSRRRRNRLRFCDDESSPPSPKNQRLGTSPSSSPNGGSAGDDEAEPTQTLDGPSTSAGAVYTSPSGNVVYPVGPAPPNDGGQYELGADGDYHLQEIDQDDDVMDPSSDPLLG